MIDLYGSGSTARQVAETFTQSVLIRATASQRPAWLAVAGLLWRCTRWRCGTWPGPSGRCHGQGQEPALRHAPLPATPPTSPHQPSTGLYPQVSTPGHLSDTIINPSLGHAQVRLVPHPPRSTSMTGEPNLFDESTQMIDDHISVNIWLWCTENPPFERGGGSWTDASPSMGMIKQARRKRVRTEGGVPRHRRASWRSYTLQHFLPTPFLGIFIALFRQYSIRS